jgi:hypothetical protein
VAAAGLSSPPQAIDATKTSRPSARPKYRRMRES